MVADLVHPWKEERMSRSRFNQLAVMSTLLLAAQWHMALSQSPVDDPLQGQRPTSPALAPVPPSPPPAPPAGVKQTPTVGSTSKADEPACCTYSECPAGAHTCVVYSLHGMGEDPSFCKWIAESLPEMVQPGSWAKDGGAGKVCYHADGKILVVHHSPAVHTKIEAYLKDLKKAMPTDKERRSTWAMTPTHLNGHVVAAAHTDSSAMKPAAQARPAGAGYPVPAPVQQPKHLFHFVIRYEGDGIDVESMVAALAKMGAEGAKEEAEKAKPDAKSPTLGQLLHLVVRYEGEGIIDSNVASLLKDLYGANMKWQQGNSVPVEMLGGLLNGGASVNRAPCVSGPVPQPVEVQSEVKPAKAVGGPTPTSSGPVVESVPTPGTSVSGSGAASVSSNPPPQPGTTPTAAPRQSAPVTPPATQPSAPPPPGELRR
jgi:hypothetical protein